MSRTDDDRPVIPINVLIIDDDEAHAQTVAESLTRMKTARCHCAVAGSGEQGAALIERENWDIVITDLRMDDIDGLQILRKAKEELPDAEVIVLTGHGSIPSAVSVMQHGASTYLTKPLDVQELRGAVQKAADRLALIRENAELAKRLDEKFGFEGVLGNSPQMHGIVETLKAVAPTDSSVLVLGETGTGKELVAKAVHQNSPRKNKPFVPLSIGDLPASTLESELFGHEKGAFTGAESRRIGKFEHANGGTLFLDEVGELPLETQVKLLRVLDSRKITRLGSNDPLDINVRLVAATNKDLKKMSEEGRFREDLYYRLRVIEINLPPLRERAQDVPILLDHFRREVSERFNKEIRGFTRPALRAFTEYEWPGNIRELRNLVEQMAILDTDGIFDVDDLPREVAPLAKPDSETPIIGHSAGMDGLIGQKLEDIERFYIEKALELTEGKRDEAATMLGISERTLYRKLKEYREQEDAAP